MFTTNKNKLIVLLFMAACTTFSLAAYNPGKPQDGFKNLQVLPKDITHEELDKIMHNFNESLGVKCMFCHVHEGDDFKAGWDMAKDDKPEKDIARMMLRMTAGINTTYFNFNNSSRPDTINVVSCITCHRGIPHPDKEGIEEQLANGMKQQAPPPPPPGPGAPGAPPKKD